MGNLCDCALVPPEKTMKMSYKDGAQENSPMQRKGKVLDDNLTPRDFYNYKEFNRAENPRFQTRLMEDDDSRVTADDSYSSNPILNQHEISHRWIALHNEATSLLVENRHEEALRRFQHALQLQLSIIGHENHPHIAVTMQNLGIVYRHCGNSEKASNCFCAAADIYARVQSTLLRHCIK
jgi:hypothetical protein